MGKVGNQKKKTLRGMPWRVFAFFLFVFYLSFPPLNGVVLENFHNFLSTILGVNVQIDGLAQIQTENAHDGLCIDDVSAGNKVEIIIEFGDVVYERFYLIN